MTTPTRPRLSLRQRLLRFITDAARRLAAAWEFLAAAQRRLLAALARIRIARGATARIREAAEAFQRSIATFDQSVAAFAERWAATDLPSVYRAGALDALNRSSARLPGGWTWTPAHQQTATTLSAQFYTDLMARLTEALRRARAFLRAALDQARRPQGVDTRQLLADHPLGTVIYAGERRHPADAWARAAVAWQTVTAANTGATQTALHDLGCDWVEIRDGAGCGWTSHEDPDTAHGSLRTVHDALAHPAAHPRCVRQILPRPDLTGYTALGDAA